MRSIAGVLAAFRFDDGASNAFSPSAPVKLVLGLGAILLTSLSRNYAFVLIVLALVLARACFLPAHALKRTAGISAAAAAFTFVLMLPAALIGQPTSALLMAGKVLATVGTAMLVVSTTPYNELTGALRVFRVPSLMVMTIDLALKNIVRLGRTALEVLEALALRSVGRTKQKSEALGGVAGTVFLKSNEAAQATFDAMQCRGFDGSYETAKRRWLKAVDALWIAGFALLLAAFIYLQGVV